MENNIDSLLSGLNNLVSDAKGTLFAGQDKCMVDRDQLLYLVDALQSAIPKEIAQAKAIVESCNELRTNAKKEAADIRRNANAMLEEAKQRAANLIEEQTIVELAKQREQEILNEAQEKHDKLISGALDYAAKIMDEAEQSVAETYSAADEGIKKLLALMEDDRKQSLYQIVSAKDALKSVSETAQQES